MDEFQRRRVPMENLHAALQNYAEYVEPDGVDENVTDIIDIIKEYDNDSRWKIDSYSIHTTIIDDGDYGDDQFMVIRFNPGSNSD